MKKIALVIAACFAFSVISSGTTYAAPKDEVKAHQQKEKHYDNHDEKQQKKVQKKEEKHNNGQLNQLKSIDKQLNQIEKKLFYYQGKLPSLSTPVTSNDSANIVTSDSATTTREDVAELETEENIDDVLKKYPGYKGKFNALKNQLNAVSNRLNSLKLKTDNKEVEARLKRVETLEKEVDEALETLRKVENKVKEIHQKNQSAKELDTIKNVEKTKEWKIKFSKKLNRSSLTNLDIIVLDGEHNLVETTMSYSDKSNSIVITPLQAYESGKTYTLYIGKNISADNGSKLYDSIKMSFSVK